MLLKVRLIGVDEYVRHAYRAAHDITTTLTLEAIIKPSIDLNSGLVYAIGIIGRHSFPTFGLDSYSLLINDNGQLHLGSAGGNIQSTKDSWPAGTLFYTAGTYNSSGLIGDLFVDGVKETLTTDGYDTMAGGVNDLVTGNQSGPDTYFPGVIGETRVSNIVRSDAWLKATYYTLHDNFMTCVQGNKPSYYYHGYIKEKSIPVARTVRLYNRESGTLMDETTSSGSNGYYYLTTSISGEHFVAAFDDDAGDSYNAVILDKLQPLGIE